MGRLDGKVKEKARMVDSTARRALPMATAHARHEQAQRSEFAASVTLPD
ncbi:hypothetical protein [Paraburkholderia sp. CI3]